MDKLYQWIEALRATDAEQIRGQTSNGEGGYCAIGIFAKDVLGMEDINPDDESPYDEVSKVLEGMTPGSAFGCPIEPDAYVYRLNDSLKLSFEEIADQLEGLINESRK